MHVTCIASLDDLRASVSRSQPDALVIDQFVKCHDTLTMLQDIRSWYRGALVMFSANQDIIDCIVALEAGADDFVTKAAGSRVLLARLRSVLRRTRLVPQPMVVKSQASSQEPSQKWLINASAQEIRSSSGATIKLTHAEFHALLYLIDNADHVLSRDDLSLNLLHRPFRPFDRCVDNLLSRIRKAIQPYIDGDSIIRSIRGHGYVFHAPELVEALDSERGAITPPQVIPLAREAMRDAEAHRAFASYMNEGKLREDARC